MKKTKQFRDPVHGYINLPLEYCEAFVDTEIFQRLRRIEQTSMRVLFPSAHHDRFIHSLGVYHLGKIAFTHLKENSEDLLASEIFEHSFLIACLLHDCAHSSFSHTFEKYYVFNKRDEINKRLFSLIQNDEEFQTDYSQISPSPHELVSAIVAVECFGEKIKRIGGDPSLVVRMILGCKYNSNKVENCLISFLNGTAIDVDKLDYIIRDSWVSGVNNVKIDDERLLSSTLIRRDSDGVFKIYYKKHALSVIKNVINGRNFLYEWIYTHHKVMYEQYLITKSITEVSKLLNDQDADQFCNTIFSIDALYHPVRFKEYEFYLPCDGDLIYVFKRFQNQISEIRELISRNYPNRALWKTKAEFLHYFREIDVRGLLNIKNKADKMLQSYFKEKAIEGKSIIDEVKGKYVSIQKHELFIDIEGAEISYTTLFPDNESKSSEPYFIIYIPKNAFQYKSDIITRLRQLK